MKTNQTRQMNKIIQLIENFKSKNISVTEFNQEYCLLWRSIRDSHIRFDEETHIILDKLFSDCDMFNSDPEVVGNEILTEDDLRKNAEIALRKLKIYFKKNET